MEHETDRLADLEARYAYQDKAVAELGSMVYEQERRLGRLEELVRQMAERMAELVPGESPNAARERPPHY